MQYTKKTPNNLTNWGENFNLGQHCVLMLCYLIQLVKPTCVSSSLEIHEIKGICHQNLLNKQKIIIRKKILSFKLI